jgi:hypothetical protein
MSMGRGTGEQFGSGFNLSVQPQRPGDGGKVAVRDADRLVRNLLSVANLFLYVPHACGAAATFSSD